MKKKKIEFIENNDLDDKDKCIIISTLSEANKRKYIKLIYGNRYIAEVLKTVKDFNCIKEVVYSKSSINDKLEIVGELSNKLDILERFNYFGDENIKKAIKLCKCSGKEKVLDRYVISDVIGIDPRMTIGVELEAEGEMSNILIGKELFGGWHSKRDGSLQNGVEIVSPILTDNVESVHDLCKICGLMQDSGLTTSERCGGHIHIGADYFKTKEEFETFLSIWMNSEETIYKMSNDNGELSRVSVERYAQPLSGKFKDALENGIIDINDNSDLIDFVREVSGVQTSRYSGVNFYNVNTSKNTIEFRLSNGTIDAKAVMENIKLYGKIMEKSKQISSLLSKDNLSEKETQMLQQYNKLINGEKSEDGKLEQFLNFIFDNDRDRKIYRTRYEKTEENLRQSDSKGDLYNGGYFSEIDFKEVFDKKKGLIAEAPEVSISEGEELNINE